MYSLQTITNTKKWKEKNVQYLDDSLGALPNPIVDNQLLLSSVQEPSSSHHSTFTAVFFGLRFGEVRFQTVSSLSYTKHSFGSIASLHLFSIKQEKIFQVIKQHK